MSLAVAIKGPEGIVLAADSRVTLEARKDGKNPFLVNYDNATKLLTFSEPFTNVGAITYGTAVIGQRTAHSHITEFEVNNKESQKLTVLDFSKRLSTFYLDQWNAVMPPDWSGPPMSFIVGGYDLGAPYGETFVFEIPTNPEPKSRNPGTQFGMTWGGQLEVACRIIHGFDPMLGGFLQQALKLSPPEAEKFVDQLRAAVEYPIPYAVLPLQDCIDLAIFLLRATMTAQSLAIGVRGVGGPIDVAIITRTKGLTYVQRKTVHGERGLPNVFAD